MEGQPVGLSEEERNFSVNSPNTWMKEVVLADGKSVLVPVEQAWIYLAGEEEQGQSEN